MNCGVGIMNICIKQMANTLVLKTSSFSYSVSLTCKVEAAVKFWQFKLGIELVGPKR